ncbi:hypothetical protein SDC9_97685 [bioreactor metagenome]|uniref:Uncharacterized protein n=1 Tax=bioreactor metagenome TaxID=1076179 RepID=A0A645ACM9_9ZZZZ
MFHNIGPLCSKGIEICSGGQNPKSITQAISQLSYALFDKLIYGFERQLSNTETDGHFIYHHIPIIITTANLYRLKNDISIQEIKKSNDLLEIATKESMLLIEPPFSIDLKNYALNKFASFESKYSLTKLNESLGKQAKSNNRGYEFHKSYMTDYPCGILAVHFETECNVFNELNQFLEEIVRPRKTTIDEIDNIFGSKISALDSFR